MMNKDKTSQDEVVKKKEEYVITGQTIDAPMPGNIFKILVKPGDIVKPGQDVLILEAMKMENNIYSEYSGTVKRLFVEEGTIVAAGTKLIEIQE